MRIATDEVIERFAHWGRVYGRLFRLAQTSRVLDHDDLTQIARIATWRACDTWDESRGTFDTYAKSCIRNAVLSALESDRASKRDSLRTVGIPIGRSGDGVQFDFPDLEGKPVEHAIDEAELLEAMLHALAALPDRDRKIIRHVYGIGAPRRLMRDLAGEIGLTRQAVSYIAQRACDQMRDALRCRGYSAADLN